MKRILITDDSGMARMFIKRCVEIVMNEEVEFFEASNGKDAIDIMKDMPMDLVLIDLNMPVMTGSEFLKRIAASPRLFGTPVIVITSVKNPAKQKELMDLGAVAVLGKPLTPPVLAAAMEDLFTNV